MFRKRRRPTPHSLGVGRSVFMGFSQKRMNLLLSTVSARLDAPPRSLRVLHDCLCLPKHEALYRLDGSRIDETMPTYVDAGESSAAGAIPDSPSAPSRVAVPEAPQEIRETVLFLGAISPHYGHLITDSLARAWALDQVDPALRVVFAPPTPFSRFPAFVPELMRAVGVPPERALSANRPMLLRRVLYPEPAIEADRVIYRGLDGPHATAAAALVPDGPSPFAGRRVYLSRSRLGPQYRALAGESVLEARLEQKGYLIVHPQELSLGEQISLFENAAVVVGVFGSAMHTVLFRRNPEPLRIAHLTAAGAKGRFLLIDALKPVESWYLNCVTLLSRPTEDPRYHLYKLEWQKALRNLEAAGFH